MGRYDLILQPDILLLDLFHHYHQMSFLHFNSQNEIIITESQNHLDYFRWQGFIRRLYIF